MMSNTMLATQAPIGTVTITGWKGCPYGPARMVLGCLACGSRPAWLVLSMVVLLKRFQGWDSASRRVPEAPADLFCQYPLVLEMNMRIERGVPGLNRLVRALGEPTRRAVYLAVEHARRPMTRLEVADTLHISRRLAAFHLDKLTEEGLLDVHYARPPGRPGGPGAGRSAKWYRASSVEFDLTIPPRRSDIAARVLALTKEQ